MEAARAVAGLAADVAERRGIVPRREPAARAVADHVAAHALRVRVVARAAQRLDRLRVTRRRPRARVGLVALRARVAAGEEVVARGPRADGEMRVARVPVDEV